MTERIDLDDLETDTQDEQRDDDGEWFWGADGDDDAPPDTVDTLDGGDRADADGDVAVGSPSSETNENRIPHVPSENKDKPVGIPVESGGAGSGGTGGEREPDAPQASGPHGGGADDLTFAFTFEAVQRLGDVRTALAEANEWADWIGIVGDVDAHEINKFLRETGLDIDFFNGSGTGPGERLAEIGPSSMFYADRMAVVGVETLDEPIAEEADWEFVSLAHAADRADWTVDAEGE